MPAKPMISQPFRQSLVGLLLLGAAFAPAAAWAQAAAPAPAAKPDVQAVAYAPIPAGARFETQANDDSELNQEALEKVNAELAGRGYAVAGGAGLVMVIETDLVRGQRQDDPLGQAFANNDEAKVQARLFSSSQNSLLNPQQPIGSADRIYRISVSVYNRASGLYVWRGSVSRSDPDLDVNQASNEMIMALMATVGKSVKGTPSPAQ
ncbi:MAG TPA: hypothetical protein VMW18_18605 [Candidatus Binatia bacterium]|nr:hypothetical protein [Candidatus Binatia bacterium]